MTLKAFVKRVESKAKKKRLKQGTQKIINHMYQRGFKWEPILVICSIPCERLLTSFINITEYLILLL